MKNNKPDMDLDQLLDTLEHAGRDQRRQKQLGDMIDSLGNATPAQPERRHKPIWWTLRVAAAACLLFFIAKTVQYWASPTSPSPLVAETKPVAIDTTQPLQNTPVSDGNSLPTLRQTDTPSALPTAIKRDIPSPFVAEETGLTAEETGIEEFNSDRNGSDRNNLEEITTETPALLIPETANALTETTEYALHTEPTVPSTPSETSSDTTSYMDELAAPIASLSAQSQTQTQPQSKPRRRRSIFRRAEPSNMDGTTLALFQF